MKTEEEKKENKTEKDKRKRKTKKECENIKQTNKEHPKNNKTQKNKRNRKKNSKQEKTNTNRHFVVTSFEGHCSTNSKETGETLLLGKRSENMFETDRRGEKKKKEKEKTDTRKRAKQLENDVINQLERVPENT